MADVSYAKQQSDCNNNISRPVAITKGHKRTAVSREEYPVRSDRNNNDKEREQRTASRQPTTESYCSSGNEGYHDISWAQSTVDRLQDDASGILMNIHGDGRRAQRHESRRGNFSKYCNRMRSIRVEPVWTPLKPCEGKLYHHARIHNSFVDVQSHDCGNMDLIFCFCGARHFAKENNVLPGYTFKSCCGGGKILLKPLGKYPKYFKHLLTSNDSDSVHFRNNICAYNTAFSFAAVRCTHVQTRLRRQGWKIMDTIKRRVPPVRPRRGKLPKYAQLYAVNRATALRLRSQQYPKLRPEILKNIDCILRKTNMFAKSFKMLKMVEKSEASPQEDGAGKLPRLKLQFTNYNGEFNRYDVAAASEVAVVLHGVIEERPKRDLIISSTGKKWVPVSSTSPHSDPMTYPLLLPNGDQGWSIGLCSMSGKISFAQFYTYLLADRGYFNPLLSAGKLTQKYIVDAYRKVEDNRLLFYEYQQEKLHVGRYLSLKDYLENLSISRGVPPNRTTVLSSSFTGGPRNMSKKYFNALTIVRAFGMPDLIITVVCNPQWDEILRNIQPGQRPYDRPDIIVRVFRMKLLALLTDLSKNHVLGVPVAMLVTVEFQQAGLPHAHILLTLRKEDKIKEFRDIDKYISAEIPDRDLNPRLYEMMQHSIMVHTPWYISPRGVSSSHKEKYPKTFSPETFRARNHYPLYRRRDNGQKLEVLSRRGSVKYKVDNRWIIPHNPYLVVKYNTHVNVELCASEQCIKYLYKYNSDQGSNIRNGPGNKYDWDEVHAYLKERTLTAPEAMWRLMGFRMFYHSHPVLCLAIHLPYTSEETPAPNTTLTAYFNLNDRDERARQYLYAEIPEHYVFNNGAFQQRKTQGKMLVRMFHVNPRQTELYHLRILLLHVKGAKSFDDIKTVRGVTYDTFEEAAQKRNLVLNSSDWDCILGEVIDSNMPRQLRQLFAILLIFYQPCNAAEVWQKYKHYMVGDFSLRYPEDKAESFGLYALQSIVLSHGRIWERTGLPQINNEVLTGKECEEREENIEGIKQVAKFNSSQRRVFKKIMRAVDGKSQKKCFFIDGPAGSGKTFLLSTLLSVLRGDGKSVVAVASTGLAAAHLKNATTVKSAFKLPNSASKYICSGLMLSSPKAQALKQVAVIVWDEVSLASKEELDAVDLFLQSLMNSNEPFGGKIVVLSGDFRQSFPPGKFKSAKEICTHYARCSAVWVHLSHLTLSTNMRVGRGDAQFSQWLLDLGNGDLETHSFTNDSVMIPGNWMDRESLLDEIYGLSLTPQDLSDYCNRAIFTPKNDDVNPINSEILNRLKTEEITYFSTDLMLGNSEDYPVEHLNSLSLPGVPSHCLTLKEGAIVTLIRNLDVQSGLCNGSRLAVSGLGENVLHCEILHGSHKGEDVFIPRLPHRVEWPKYPSVMLRFQFPLQLDFAMTIDKARGLTLDRVGVYLPKPVFAHGMLYQAFSRCRSKDGIAVTVLQVDDGPNLTQGMSVLGEMFTRNIVYKNVFCR